MITHVNFQINAFKSHELKWGNLLFLKIDLRRPSQ